MGSQESSSVQLPPGWSGTKPEDVDPGITVVGNGWISLAAYQAKGCTYISAD
jgi:hypothetical protein